MTVLQIECARETANSVAAPPERIDVPVTREVRHEYTRTFPALLDQLGVSLLVSTYQAGKVVAVGVAQGELTLSYHNFERAMGLAVKPDCIAVGARAQVWFLTQRSRPGRPRRAGRPPRRLLPDALRPTSPARSRPTSWPGPATNCGWSTRPSAACARSTTGTASCRAGGRRSSPRWRPRTAATSTAWRMAGRHSPKYVTALAETDTPQGWRPNKAHQRLPDRRRQRPDGGARLRHAALAARPRRPGLDAALGGGATGAGRSGQRPGGDGDRTARLHARPGPVRPLRVRRPVEDPRDLDVRRHADRRAAAGAEVRRRRRGPGARAG